MRLIARFTLALACLALASFAAAATYYVDPGGNDANPGTSAQPWRTIQKAAGVVAAGDTVIVRAGSYSGRVAISRSGTASAPIRFAADGTVSTAGFTVRANYVQVSGFRITAVAARYSVDGAGVQVAGTGCLVENNVISRCGYFGVHVDVGSRQVVIRGNLIDQCALAGINVHGTGHLIEDNEIRDIRVSMAGNTYGDADGLYIFDSGHVIRGNYIHSISLSANAGYTPHIDGVHSWTANKYVAMSDCVFERNVFDFPETTSANHTAGFMIEGNPRNIMIRNNVFRAGRVVHFVTGTNIRVLNNTLVGRLSWPTARNPAGIYFERTSSSVVRNNLIIDFPWNAVYISGNSGLTIGNNCTWNSNGTRPGGTAQSGDLWGVNPRVASLDGFDFHLLVDSPCRDAGVALSDVTSDFDGRARPYGSQHDIGAFEYGAGGGGGSTNRAPAAGFTATPQTGQAPLIVAFDGRYSGDTDGTLVSFAWSFGDGASANGAVVSHTYASAGSYTARLTVTDNGGLTASTTRTISVTQPSVVNRAPAAGFTATPQTGQAPLTVAFDGRYSGDTDGTLVSFAWSFGDGASANGAVVSHTYASAGTFTARLTVTDNGGLTASTTRIISVAAAGDDGGSGGTGSFYVDSARGDDANPGTATLPWRTIQKAAASVAAGAEVTVRPGTYDERVVITRSGTAAAPIRFTANGVARTRGFSIRADHVQVKGFVCTSTGARGSEDAAGIFVRGISCRIDTNIIQQTANAGILLDPAAKFCTIAGNICNQTALAGIVLQGEDHLVLYNRVLDTRVTMGGNAYGDADGIQASGPRHVIRGNLIHHITLEANAGAAPTIEGILLRGVSDGVVEQNFIDLPIATAATHAAGVMAEGGSRNVLIRNNIVRAGRGVQVLTGTSVRVLNNTLIGWLSWSTGHNPAGIYIEQTAASAARNNIICDYPWNAIYEAGNTDLSIGANCTWNTDGTRPAGTAQPGDLWGVNPGFMAYYVDFRLQPWSPCVDRCGQSADVPSDFAGLARPYGAGIDMGAYEFRPAGVQSAGATQVLPAFPFPAEFRPVRSIRTSPIEPPTRSIRDRRDDQ